MNLPLAARPLFELPPEQFTAERDRTVRQLKDCGDPAGAAAVKSLKRPSNTAYALNLVARRHGYLVDRLLDADQNLRTATSRQAMDSAKADRQQAIAAISSQAVALLGEQGRPATAQLTHRITQTLLAVGTDEQTRASLRGGYLEKEAAPGGFGGPVVAFESPAPSSPNGTAEREKRRAKALTEIEELRAEASKFAKRAEMAIRESDQLAAASASALLRGQQLRKRAEEAEAAADERRAALERLQKGHHDA